MELVKEDGTLGFSVTVRIISKLGEYTVEKMFTCSLGGHSTHTAASDNVQEAHGKW